MTRRFCWLTLTLVVLLAISAVAAAPGEERFSIHAWPVDEHTDAIFVEDHRAPVVYVSLEFPVGTWSGWGQDDDLLSAMAIQVYDPEGELRRRADSLAATVSGFASARHSGMYGWCLKDDLPGLLDLMRDVITNDRFDRKELKRWKQQAKLSWKASDTDVQFRGRQLVARSLFQPGDPRRRRYEEPRRVETDPEELRRIRDRIVRLSGRVIGLAGDLTREEAERLAAGLLPDADPEPALDAEPALLPIRTRVERSDSEALVRNLTQVYFGLGRESLTYDDPDYPAFVLANHVLGGHFYSRIMVALRHEGGETYGAFARAETDVDPAPYVVGSFTNTANATHAEETLREALREFHEGGITEDERSDASGYLTGNAPFDRQVPYQVLNRRMTERRLGLPSGFLEDVPVRASALSLDEINAFIAEYYEPDAFVMGRVASK